MLVTAGFGTRLAPLTDELPKPAVPVANRPLAWFAMDHLARNGVRELVLNTHHLAAELRACMEPLAPTGMSLSFSHETSILGTGGGIKRAWQPLEDEDFVVMNGKLVFAPDIRRLLDVHRTSGAIATMVLKRMPAGASFGAVDIASDGTVREILSAAPVPQAGLERAMFTGVHVLSARAWRDLPENGCVIRDAYLHWLARGERVMGWMDDAPFRDAGISAAHYLEANLALLDGTLRWPGIAPTGGALVASDARLGAGTKLSRSAVGANACVDAAYVERCVIWPGAHVSADARNSIITTRGHVVPVNGVLPRAVG